MQRKQKILALVCAASLAVSMAACSSSSTDGADSSTITGKVTSIDGTSVTLQLGELETAEQGEMGEQPSGSGEMPSDNGGGTPPAGGDSADSGGTPPEQPDGESASGDSAAADSGSGEMPGGGGQQPSGDGEMPEMQTFTAGDEEQTIDLADAAVTEETMNGTEDKSVSDIEEGDVLVIELNDDGSAASVTIKAVMGGDMNGGGMGAGGGGDSGSGEVTQGTAANTIDADGSADGETYTSEGDDENALRVDGAAVELTNITVNKSAGASSSTGDGDYYGMNAALLATNGAQVTISGANVSSSAQNGNGVFSYGEGTAVSISDSTINTTADNSGGIQTTGGGTTNAANLTVTTAGNSSAAIRSDRGGGTVNVDGGTYTSNGYNSPAVYSTAAITVKNAGLTATNSEALVIEGQNSIALEGCTVSGNMSDTEGTSSDENVHNVMIYQSMSGDAEVGSATFSMTGGSLTSQNGDMFFITNTTCDITLSGVTIANEDADANLMTITGNSASRGWGTAGANGAQATVTASGQELEGNIVVDSISTLSLSLTNGSSLTGTISITDNAEGGDAVENNAAVTIDEGCTWTLTGDCTVTSVENNGTINYNGYTITLADGTVMEG